MRLWQAVWGNRRRRTLWMALSSLALLIGIVVLGQVLGTRGLETHLEERNRPPCLAHPFGTDWMGRDM
ncbi:MAG: ABC transporter permease, partial [Anaerolineae bacterium]|nr:ABC transporter permease [Anaerolineae bacterium]